MTKKYIKGIVTGKTRQLKHQPIVDDKIYYITDLPENSIKNSLMRDALQDPKLASLLKENNIYLCLDDGEYKKNHLYRYISNAWEDVTVESSIIKLIGTEDEPINFATDMEEDKLYSCSGSILGAYTNATWSASAMLVYKISSNQCQIFNQRVSVSNNSVSTTLRKGVVSIVTFNSSSGILSSSSYNGSILTMNGHTPDEGSFYAPTSYGTANYILKSGGENAAPTWVYLNIGLNGTSYSPSGSISFSFYAPTSSGSVGQVLQSSGSGKSPVWVDSPFVTDGNGDKYLSNDGTYKYIVIPEVVGDNLTIKKLDGNVLETIGVKYSPIKAISGETINEGLTLTRYDDREIFTINKNLVHCDMIDSEDKVGFGDTFISKVTASAGYRIDKRAQVYISMGDEDITKDSFDFDTNQVIIENITGDILISINPAKDAVTPLSANSWQLIKDAFDYGFAPSSWLGQVKDGFQLVDNTRGRYRKVDGTGKTNAVFQSYYIRVDLRSPLGEDETMPDGYAGSIVNMSVLPAELEKLPENIKSIMSEVYIKAPNASYTLFTGFVDVPVTLYIPSIGELQVPKTSTQIIGDGSIFTYFMEDANNRRIRQILNYEDSIGWGTLYPGYRTRSTVADWGDNYWWYVDHGTPTDFASVTSNSFISYCFAI